MKNRKDAIRVDVPGLMQCCIDLKPQRWKNEVYINSKMDVTPLCDFIEDKAKEGIKYTYFYAFVTAIGKVIYNRERLNQFISNRHLYKHKDVTISFVAKMTLDDKSEEIMLVIPIEPNDNIDSISKKVSDKVNKLRNNKAEKKGANSAIDVLGHLPNIIRVPIFVLIKWLDKIGHLPDALAKDNIYFSSMIVSNLGSIHCGAIYHNLNDFGTASSLATIGEITTEQVFDKDGSSKLIKSCEFGITLDERIGDGFYFAKSAKMIEYILQNPQLLYDEVSKKVEMK